MPTPYDVLTAGQVCVEAEPEGPPGPPYPIASSSSFRQMQTLAEPVTQQSCFATCGVALGGATTYYFSVLSNQTMTQCYCCLTCTLVDSPDFTVRGLGMERMHPFSGAPVRPPRTH